MHGQLCALGQRLPLVALHFLEYIYACSTFSIRSFLHRYLIPPPPPHSPFEEWLGFPPSVVNCGATVSPWREELAGRVQ